MLDAPDKWGNEGGGRIRRDATQSRASSCETLWLDHKNTMAHQRTVSNVEAVKEPHSVSLKVLRQA